jgi:RND family efflux transporter MFP subunit
MRRLPLIGLLLAAAGTAAWFGWQKFRPAEVTLATPTRGPAIDAVYATGLVQPSLEIRIAPRAAGRIVALLVDEGDTVKAGQLLARLEDSDLAAGVAELQTRATYAAKQLERNSELKRSGLVAQDAVDRSRTDLEAARATLKRSHEQLDYMRLVAPAAGRIIRRDGEVGEFVPVNQVIFYMAGPAPLRIAADVDEEDVPRIQQGQRVLIRNDAFPDKVFEGRVSDVTPRGDPIARAYRVRIALVDNPPLQIGMSAETNIVIQQRDDALLVPVSAVVGDAVWGVQDGRAVRRPIRIGVRSAERIEVRGGLAATDRFIVDPPADLAEGTRVTVRAAPVAAPAAATKPAPSPAP